MGKNDKDESAKDKMNPGKNPRKLTKKEAEKLAKNVIFKPKDKDE